MKKLILLLFIPLVSFGQGEQLYADGTANDQEGNTFEWINYGEQDWSIENAEVVTYRDGTPILQVSDEAEWQSLTTGAWCYVNNDPTKRKLYNWYAVAGIHDTDSSTPKKEFAPAGWRVSNESDWLELKDYLISNGYNFDSTIEGNKIAKSMASTVQWNESSNEGAVGNNPSINNLSGFNAFPDGFRELESTFKDYGVGANFWVWMVNEGNTNPYYWLANYDNYLQTTSTNMKEGLSVRFVRNASTASLNDFTNSITLFPNPSSQYINITIDTEMKAVVFDLLGKELIRENITGRLDISSLEKGTYILNLTDGINTSTHKIIKE